jgi:fatty acid desaturase
MWRNYLKKDLQNNIKKHHNNNNNNDDDDDNEDERTWRKILKLTHAFWREQVLSEPMQLKERIFWKKWRFYQTNRRKTSWEKNNLLTKKI